MSLLAFLKSEAADNEKAAKMWKVAGSERQEYYHTGACHQCQRIVDHIERTPVGVNTTGHVADLNDPVRDARNSEEPR